MKSKKTYNGRQVTRKKTLRLRPKLRKSRLLKEINKPATISPVIKWGTRKELKEFFDRVMDDELQLKIMVLFG